MLMIIKPIPLRLDAKESTMAESSGIPSRNAALWGVPSAKAASIKRTAATKSTDCACHWRYSDHAVSETRIIRTSRAMGPY